MLLAVQSVVEGPEEQDVDDTEVSGNGARDADGPLCFQPEVVYVHKRV